MERYTEQINAKCKKNKRKISLDLRAVVQDDGEDAHISAHGSLLSEHMDAGSKQNTRPLVTTPTPTQPQPPPQPRPQLHAHVSVKK